MSPAQVAEAQANSAALLARIVNNPAAAFDLAARAQLAQIEGDRADVEGRNARKRASSASEVARILGCPNSQWNTWTQGHKSPSYATIVGWMLKWEAAGYEPIELTISSKGARS